MSVSLYMCWLDSSLLQTSPSAWGTRNPGADRFGPHFCWLPSPEKDRTSPLDLILNLLKQTWLAYLPSSHLILCHPLLLPHSIFPSIRVFSNEPVLCIRWPKYWSFSWTSVLPMNIHNWFPLVWTGWISLHSKELSSLLQHHSSKASILQCSAFFIVQLTSVHDFWKNYSFG